MFDFKDSEAIKQFKLQFLSYIDLILLIWLQHTICNLRLFYQYKGSKTILGLSLDNEGPLESDRVAERNRISAFSKIETIKPVFAFWINI